MRILIGLMLGLLTAIASAADHYGSPREAIVVDDDPARLLDRPEEPPASCT